MGAGCFCEVGASKRFHLFLYGFLFDLLQFLLSLSLIDMFKLACVIVVQLITEQVFRAENIFFITEHFAHFLSIQGNVILRDLRRGRRIDYLCAS